MKRQAKRLLTPPLAQLSAVYQFVQYDFFGNVTDLIHGADPRYLILAFKMFCNSALDGNLL